MPPAVDAAENPAVRAAETEQAVDQKLGPAAAHGATAANELGAAAEASQQIIEDEAAAAHLVRQHIAEQAAEASRPAGPAGT